MTPPLVSVVMPVRNAERYLEQAIDSILSQTHRDFELIVVDDASTDRSRAIVQVKARSDERIILVENPVCRRVPGALNDGLHRARGRYVARMDADDWSYPERLARQVAFMECHPQVVVSGATIEICDDELQPLNLRRYQLTDQAVRKYLFRFSPFAHPVTIWRRDLLVRVGGYNEALAAGEDYELYFRVGQHGEFANLPDTLLRLRAHVASATQRQGRQLEATTLYLRWKACFELGYRMGLGDRLYWCFQLISMLILPPRLKFWLFNFLRGSGLQDQRD